MTPKRKKKWWEYAPWSANQKEEVKSGVALMRHVRSAHGGEYRPECAGCRELLKKSEKENNGNT